MAQYDSQYYSQLGNAPPPRAITPQPRSILGVPSVGQQITNGPPSYATNTGFAPTGQQAQGVIPPNMGMVPPSVAPVPAPVDPSLAAPVPQTNPAVLPPVTLPTQYANPQPINQGGQVAPPTGLIGSENALMGGFLGAQQSMQEGQQGAEQILGQTAQQGQTAANMQAALTDPNSGASYVQSPAAKYQMEQMQRAVERSAATRGSLGSGNTLRALQENAAGIASQDAQNQFNNLGAVADRGALLQGRIADLRSSLGLNQGRLFTQTGDQLASGRTNAGLAIAENVSNTSTNISNLLREQGIQVSGQMGDHINTISNLLHESGMGDKADSAQLATILANIATGAASTAERGNTAIGEAKAAGTYGVNSAIQNGAGMALKLGAFSSAPNNSQTLGASRAGYTDEYFP